MLNNIPQDGLTDTQTFDNIPQEGLTDTQTQAPKTSLVKRIGLGLFALLFLGGVGFIATHVTPKSKPDKSARQRSQISPVTVATVTQKTVPVQLEAIGNVQAGSTVSITPQASGRILGVYFKKGQEVKKGQLLFTLDDRSQIASIQQAQGTVAKDQALVQQARANFSQRPRTGTASTVNFSQRPRAG